VPFYQVNHIKPVVFLFLSVCVSVAVSGQTAAGAVPELSAQEKTGSLPASLKNRKNPDRPSVALVLGGGGAMGIGHLPVLEVIEELDIPVDMVIGISMGAIVGGLYCSGLSLDKIKTLLLKEDWPRIFNDRPRNSLRNMLNNKNDFPVKITLNRQMQPSAPPGYSSGVYIYELLKSNTIKIPSYYDFDALPVPFRTGAVDERTGEFKILESGDIAEAIRASMSIPGFFQPFPIDGKYYLDGGVKNNFPLDVAKELGFDIIIGVDIYERMPEPTAEAPHKNILNLRRKSLTFDKNIMMITQMVKTNFMPEKKPAWDAADLIIVPDVDNYTIVDFLKVEDIYKSAEKDKQQYINALLPVMEKIKAAKKEKEASDKTGSDETDSIKISYDTLPYIVIDDVRFEGLLPFDSRYINNAYNKLIKNKKITEKNIDEFIRIINNTGNYDYIITRIDTRDGANTLNVILANNTMDLVNTEILASLAYEGTASSDSVSTVSLLGGINFNGLSGPDSRLSLLFSVPSNISGTVSYLHPFTPDMFLFGDITAFRKQITIVSGSASIGIPNGEERGNSKILVNCGGGASFGIKFNESNLLMTGPGFDYMNCSSGLTDNDSFTSLSSNAFSFRFDYRLSTLNSSIYAVKGLYINVVTTFVFPVEKASPVYNMLSIDSSAAFPIAGSFSIIANIFAGADIPGNPAGGVNSGQKPFFGFTTDRMYFPQIANDIYYYSNKAAASLLLQFRPWQNITILGGQLVLSLGASVGKLDDTLSNFKEFSDYYWNTSVNLGLKITDKTGLSLRAGMGRTLTGSPSPFLAFDAGVFRY
jgi:NTE family protein